MRHPGHDDLAAYAIGGLTDREERSVAHHLDRCDRCAAELRERLAPAVAVLAESVDQVEPPDTLRQSVMAQVHADARTAAPHAEAREPGEPERRGRSRPAAALMRPAAGLAAVALAAAGVAGYLIAGEGGDGGEGAAETVPITQAAGGAGGSLVFEDGSATLHMHGMKQLEKGSVYQVWVADSSGVKPSATFLPHEDGTATAALPEARGDVTEVMVTAEPGPGTTEPTLPAVIDVRL